MSAAVVERVAEVAPVAYLPMFTVLTPTGAIVCQSRLLDVALGYLSAGAVLLRDGVPYTTR